MTKTDVAKNITSFVVGMTVSKVVKEIIANNTVPVKAIDKVAVIVASLVLGEMIADASKVWTDAKIDAVITWWTKNITEKTSS